MTDGAADAKKVFAARGRILPSVETRNVYIIVATTAQAVKVGIGPKVALLRPAGRNSTANSRALNVNSSGYVDNNNVTNTNGVRPAFPQSMSAE